MKVKVKNSLSGRPTIIAEDVEPVWLERFDYPIGDDSRSNHQIAQLTLRDFQEIFGMCSRYNKCMPVMDGTDIENRNRALVLIQHLCRSLMANDVAELTFHDII